MRLGPTVLTLALLGAGGALSVAGGVGASAAVERISVRLVAEQLLREGHDWAGVEADGLQVILTGVAPSEAARFSARGAAARVVEGTRVIDGMDVVAIDPLEPPHFTVEILRNGADFSLIGLIPQGYDTTPLNRQLTRGAGAVTDLLETADYPLPEGWDMAMDYATAMLQRLPQSKISVAPGEVRITALVDSAEQKNSLEAELVRRAPDDLRLALDITAPRPVISPFTLRFLIPADGPPRFDACTADTAVARARILSAARKAGLEGTPICPIGLGAPGSEWAPAVEAGIAAVDALGGGTITFSDTSIALRALPDADPEQFETVQLDLQAALPEFFRLTAILPPKPEASPSNDASGPAEFLATRAPEGQVQLRGLLTEDLTRVAVESLARARFGAGEVHTALGMDPSLPANWGVRVMAGLEGLAQLERGVLSVTKERVALRGVTTRETAQADIARIFSDRLDEGADFNIDVTYEAPPEIAAPVLTAQDCIDRINAITAERKITFDPGSVEITGDTIGVIADIADVLRACHEVDKQIEIAGHTDSQGREEMNRNLSQSRADAVLNALAARRVLTGKMTARGYGESEPIADNDTEEGREANRRIEFRLLSPQPAPPPEEDDPPLSEAEPALPTDTGPPSDTAEAEAEAPGEAEPTEPEAPAAEQPAPEAETAEPQTDAEPAADAATGSEEQR